MIKYICNHCGTETDNSRDRLMSYEMADVHLCGECFGVFNKLQQKHDENIRIFTEKEDQIIKEFLNV